MIQIVTYKIVKNVLIDKITNFYIKLYHDRLVNFTKRKYSYTQARNNILNILSFFNMTFNDNELRKPTLIHWKNKNWYEVKFKNWHFAVIVQLDMFGNNTAIVQDCVHDKDYHNDIMQTKPFEKDNDDDASHLVDWKEYHLNRLISETLRNSIRKLL